MSHAELTQTHEKVVAGAGLVALDGWDALSVTGSDRGSFLHNMCTNQVRDLPPGEGCEAFFTDVKGKAVAHALILMGEVDALLCLAPGQAERLAKHLDRYIIREDVQLGEPEGGIDWTLLLGAQAEAVVNATFSGEPLQLRGNLSHARRDHRGGDVGVVRSEASWCGGLLLHSGREQTEPLRRDLQSTGAVPCSEKLWHAIRIESGWPLFGVDFDDSNLVQEAGRDSQAINLRKGCYLGQETIARVDALGHVNKRLVLVRVDGDPPPAKSELQASDRAAGHVTSSTWSPRVGASLALGMVRHGFDESGSQLSCLGQPAEVL